MRLALRYAVTILAGLACGSGVAVASLRAMGMGVEAHQGWSGSHLAGSVDAGAMLRARVAISGLLALNRTQALYFTRTTDSSGNRLREDCRYRLSGSPLPGRWWSITAYAPDNYLPQNDDDALSVDASEVRPDAAGQWSAEAGPSRPKHEPWISTARAGAFDLTLRIYNPAPSAQRDFASIPLPQVERLDCAGEAR